MTVALIARVRMPLAAHGSGAPPQRPRRTAADADGDSGLPRAAGRALVAVVLLLHLLGAWALLQIEPVRQAAAELAPVFIQLAAPAAPQPPAPASPATLRPRVGKAPPSPLLAAPPLPDAAPRADSVPLQPDPAPSPPPPVPAPVAAVAPPPAPVPPAPPPPALPRAVPSTAVRYLQAPAPVYPSASRRLGESGEVRLRVEIDSTGHARQVQVQQSSGWPRLDDAALAAVRAARFVPYTDHGVPVAVWTVVPIVFELEN